MKIDPKMRHAGKQLRAAPKGKVLVIPMEDLDAMLRLLRIIKRENDFSILVTRPGTDPDSIWQMLRAELMAKAA